MQRVHGKEDSTVAPHFSPGDPAAIVGDREKACDKISLAGGSGGGSQQNSVLDVPKPESPVLPLGGEKASIGGCRVKGKLLTFLPRRQFAGVGHIIQSDGGRQAGQLDSERVACRHQRRRIL